MTTSPSDNTFKYIDIGLQQVQYQSIQVSEKQASYNLSGLIEC